jgi:hypothetical protein
MICPHCQFELETETDRCPGCGIRIVRKISGIVKTSTVMIATGSENNFYRSVQEVPESLRRQLIEMTSGENSGVVVIADRAGKEHWTEIVAQREAEQEREVVVERVSPPPARGFAGLPWAAWVGILLFLAAAAMVASVFQVFHW